MEFLFILAVIVFTIIIGCTLIAASHADDMIDVRISRQLKPVTLNEAKEIDKAIVNIQAARTNKTGVSETNSSI